MMLPEGTLERRVAIITGGGAYIDEMTQEIPAGRFAEVEEIVDVASFLVSDYADYITGATMAIDGGASLNKGFLRFAEDLPSHQA
jgi:enoyl-[acyl-carrier-protein] reductase (NADH)